jgi:hypothetical protein
MTEDSHDKIVNIHNARQQLNTDSDAGMWKYHMQH